MVFLFLFHSVLAYDTSYFLNAPVQVSSDNARFPINTEDMWIFQSMFSHFVSRAISLYQLDFELRLMIEECTFYNVSSRENGGAIYFYNAYGGYSLKKTCANSCFTSSISGSYQFGYFYAKDTAPAEFLLCSLTKCPGISGGRYNPIYFHRGRHNNQNSNISHIYGCYNYGCLRIDACSIGNFSYNTVFNCSCSTYPLIDIYILGSFYKINNYNFVSNSVGAKTNFLIDMNVLSSQNVLIENSVFYKNFGILIRLLNSGYITFDKSVLMHQDTLTSGSSITINTFLNTITTINITSTLPIVHWNTELCPAQYTSQVSEEEIQTPHQTIPPPPTECEFPSNNQAQILNIQAIYLITLHLWFI